MQQHEMKKEYTLDELMKDYKRDESFDSDQEAWLNLQPVGREIL